MRGKQQLKVFGKKLFKTTLLRICQKNASDHSDNNNVRFSRQCKPLSCLCFFYNQGRVNDTEHLAIDDEDDLIFKNHPFTVPEKNYIHLTYCLVKSFSKNSIKNES